METLKYSDTKTKIKSYTFQIKTVHKDILIP